MCSQFAKDVMASQPEAPDCEIMELNKTKKLLDTDDDDLAKWYIHFNGLALDDIYNVKGNRHNWNLMGALEQVILKRHGIR